MAKSAERGGTESSSWGLEGSLGEWSPALRKAQVYDRILLDIILGALAPGSRLDEQVLIRRYDAGLAGVRDALGRLALEGMVDRRPRAGTTVAPLDIIEVKQAFEARSLIEPHCAALAAVHATEADLAVINSAFDKAEAAITAADYRALVSMDQRFHVAIARASGNPTLARIVIPLQHKATRFWVYCMGNDTKEDRLADIKRHREVARCIARRDQDAARESMMAILGGFPETMKRMVGVGAGAAA